MRKALCAPLLASCFFTLAAGSTISAQQAVTTASVTGRIVDASGGAVARAAITIRSVERNQTLQARSSDDGSYRFLSPRWDRTN